MATNIKETIKKEWVVLLLVLLPFAASAILWSQLPERVPIHFNARGEANGWGPKWVNAFLLPLIGVGTYLGMLILPVLDPKKKIAIHQKAISAIRIALSLFLVGMYAVIMAKSLGVKLDMQIWLQAGTGMLFMVLGNYMSAVKHNYFIGIRTPWTLESAEVWKKTHRLGGKVFVVCGLLLLLFAFVPGLNEPHVLTALIVVLVVIPVAYSWFAYRALKSFDGKIE